MALTLHRRDRQERERSGRHFRSGRDRGGETRHQGGGSVGWPRWRTLRGRASDGLRRLGERYELHPQRLAGSPIVSSKYEPRGNPTVRHRGGNQRWAKAEGPS